jgi:hypothetical protein
VVVATRLLSEAALQCSALVRYRCANAEGDEERAREGWSLTGANPRCLTRHQSSCRRTCRNLAELRQVLRRLQPTSTSRTRPAQTRKGIT